MYDSLTPQNAVIAIRVSTVKQGIQGDSPEAQEEQIRQFAAISNVKVKKRFVFLESASQEEQPMQEVINYCKNPKNDVQFFIVKSIDRFTRCGVDVYFGLKSQLEDCGVSLMDTERVISSQKVNTLEHLGVKYNWSEYYPTRQSEIMVAERARDEKRDIMSRMVGAEIRYARLGYWVRRAPIGLVNKTVETIHGRRCVLEPHPVEGLWMLKVFELLERGVEKQRVVREANKLGFKTRVIFVRSPHNKKIIARKGGKKLDIKRLDKLISNPIYAGVNNEIWLQGAPVRCQFKGLVSIETFNRANRGRITIVEENGVLSVRTKSTEISARRTRVNPDYPYKRVVLCPFCEWPLYGSASRGHTGKLYPAYHCNKRGHYFRATKKVFDETIERFLKTVRVARPYGEQVAKAVIREWHKRQVELGRDDFSQSVRIQELKLQAELAAEKLRFLSPDVMKYVEKQLLEIEVEIAQIEADRVKPEAETVDDLTLARYAKYFTSHPEKLTWRQTDPLLLAGYMGLLFDQKPPTYTDIVNSLDDKTRLKQLSEVFVQRKPHKRGAKVL